MSLLLRASIRHHSSRPSRVLLTIFGVGAAVALLFATSLLNSTLRTSIDKGSRGLEGAADFEVVDPISSGISSGVERAITHVQGVDTVVPIVKMTSRIREGGRSVRTLVIGVPPSFVNLFPGEWGSSESELPRHSGTEALLGPGLTRNEEVSVVSLETPGGYRAVKSFGAGDLPFSDLNEGAFVVLGLRTARRMFERGKRSDVLYVIRSRQIPHKVLHQRLSTILKGDAVLTTPTGQTTAYRQSFESLAQLTELGAAGALWVAVFAVFNALSMSLLERRQTVALLATLGATRRQLGAVFLAEAALFGIFGSVVGMAIGYLLAKLLLAHAVAAYPFLPLSSTSHIDVRPAIVLMTIGVSLLVSILGAAVPIRRTLSASAVQGLSQDAAYEWSAHQQHHRLKAIRLLVGLGCLAAAALSIQSGPLSRSSAGATLALALLLTGALLVLPPVVRALLRASNIPLQRTTGRFGLLAISALLKNQGRTSLVVGILALSLSLAVALSVALFSFESAMTKAFTDRYGPPLYVTASSYSGVTSDQPLSGRVAEEIGSVPGVKTVYPERYAQFDLGDKQAVAVSAPMVREARDGFTNSLASSQGVSHNSLIAGLSRGGVVLSTYTADLNGVEIGDRFPLPGLSVSRAPEVVGLYDDLLSLETMYMERDTYLRISGDTRVDRVAVAPDPNIPGRTIASRLKLFLRRHQLPAIVETRKELVDSVLANVRGAFSIARALQLAAILIAGLIVASTMLTTVSERRWEFAVCRALGMSRAHIRGGVLLEAFVLGLLGSVIALAIGLTMGLLMLEAMSIRFLWKLGYTASWPQLAVIVAIVIATVLVAAALPARIAGRSSVASSLSTP